MNINKVLSEKLGLDEETKNLIIENWNSQLAEAREEIEEELREEYATKYEHDKNKIISAVDKRINEQLQSEMAELAEDRSNLRKSQVEYKKSIQEHAKVLNRHINRQLVKELREFKEDRAEMHKKIKLAESLIDKKLNEEISEFVGDTTALREIKVKQLSEHNKKLAKLRKDYITEASKKVNSFLNETMKKEISQYRQDIIEARNNDFGKRIFEAFASEYLTSYLNEHSEINKLTKQINKLQETTKKQQKVLEEAQNRYKANKSILERERKLSKLLSPLSRENKALMSDLLENVSNEKLDETFEKYLPAVLNEKNNRGRTNTIVLSEKSRSTGNRKEMNGNRRKLKENKSDDFDSEYQRELDQIVKFAGIKGD